MYFTTHNMICSALSGDRAWNLLGVIAEFSVKGLESCEATIAIQLHKTTARVLDIEPITIGIEIKQEIKNLKIRKIPQSIGVGMAVMPTLAWEPGGPSHPNTCSPPFASNISGSPAPQPPATATTNPGIFRT